MDNETKEFIGAAGYVHGDTHDYDQTVYRGPGLKVKIICPTHGTFLQMPEAHLAGFPCPDCSTVRVNVIGPVPATPPVPVVIEKPIPKPRKPRKRKVVPKDEG